MAKIEEEYAQIQKDLTETRDALKAYADSTTKATAESQNLSREVKASVDGLLTQQTELTERLKAAEQLIVKLDEGKGSTRKSESMGEIFTMHEDFEVLAQTISRGGKASLTVPVKATITSLPGSAGSLIEPTRVGLIQPVTQRLFLRDLLSKGRTTSNSVEFVRESGFTNNANVVSENPTNPKPESNITFTPDTVPVVTIAHWIHASRQVLADVAMLQSYIDTRLRYGLALKEEAQLLKGSGVGLNIDGIFTQATNYLNPGVNVQGETALDRLRIALLQVTLADLDPDGIVLSPIDWTSIELLKDGELRYLFTQPQGVATPTLWGKPVVATKSMDASDFLVGSFQQGAQLWDREDASVTVSTEDRDNFVKNMVTILGEERVALTVYRTEAFVKGELPAVSP